MDNNVDSPNLKTEYRDNELPWQRSVLVFLLIPNLCSPEYLNVLCFPVPEVFNNRVILRQLGIPGMDNKHAVYTINTEIVHVSVIPGKVDMYTFHFQGLLLVHCVHYYT